METKPDPNRVEFAKRMTALANVIPNFVLSPTTLEMYERLLVPKLGWQRLCGALERILLDRDTRDPFPSPRQIVALFEPQADPEANAVAAANAILEAISKDGYTNPERARARMGELAWSIVESEGGWHKVCENVVVDRIPTYRAQWIKFALAKQTRALAGAPEKPALPHSQPQSAAPGGELRGFGDLVKQIADRSKS